MNNNINNTHLIETVLITEQSYQLIKDKLIELEKESKIIAERLAYAKTDGDLSENADYNALKEKLEINHDKIRRIRKELENSKIIKRNDNNNQSIRIGNKVEYLIINTNKTFEV